MGHHTMATFDEPRLVFFFNEGVHLGLADLTTAQLNDFHELEFADLKHVPDTSNHIIIYHRDYLYDIASHLASRFE